ncbi:hypothetical protein GYMLUDRAFT_45672 [Collybiopsis luxurians FD-317 M1]|uniref:TRIP4/RQT4 C2HC5-type zinc finger domain-containing protein n=1 Tax=Collybiopsis luxurians FD-317 M1 TaxID=944289 RepID=A0A0D0BS51_9AGAR|nr:hypothetical protein GYMLUDRAFT_45672 [Collybiopsis luxurians FD-317 M1]
MAYHTPWTQRHGSLPSDRIKPSNPNTSQSTPKGKGKISNSEQGLPKSREVRKLEGLLSALRGSQEPKKDPKGGCFCQAREHPLSPYTSICRTCGLILCTINQPNFACPHCLTSLIPGNLRESLISRLEIQLDEIIAKEVAERERAIEEAKRQAGAFPTLSGATPPLSMQKPSAPQPQTHKVISLGSNSKSKSKSKKVTISSYTTTPVTSRPASRSETEDEEEERGVVRIPPPPAEVNFAHSGNVDPARPWANLGDEENPVYIALSANEGGRGLEGKSKGAGGSANRKGHRNEKGKGKETSSS